MYAVAGGLEEGYEGVGAGGEGRAYAEYAEEFHAVGHGLASPDEYAYELMGKAEVDCGAKPGQACGYGSGGEHRGAHTLVVACRVVVGYQGKHALGHAAHHAVSQHVHLFGHAYAGLSSGAGERHQVIQHAVGDVLAQRHKAGRYAGAQNVRRYGGRQHCPAGGEVQRRMGPVFAYNYNEVY